MATFSFPSRIAGHHIGYSERFEDQHLRGRYSYDDGYGGYETWQSRRIQGVSFRGEPFADIAFHGNPPMRNWRKIVWNTRC